MQMVLPIVTLEPFRHLLTVRAAQKLGKSESPGRARVPLVPIKPHAKTAPSGAEVRLCHKTIGGSPVCPRIFLQRVGHPPQFPHALLRSPNIEVIESRLPECPPPRLQRKQFPQEHDASVMTPESMETLEKAGNQTGSYQDTASAVPNCAPHPRN